MSSTKLSTKSHEEDFCCHVDGVYIYSTDLVSLHTLYHQFTIDILKSAPNWCHMNSLKKINRIKSILPSFSPSYHQIPSMVNTTHWYSHCCTTEIRSRNAGPTAGDNKARGHSGQWPWRQVCTIALVTHAAIGGHIALIGLISGRVTSIPQKKTAIRICNAPEIKKMWIQFNFPCLF